MLPFHALGLGAHPPPSPNPNSPLPFPLPKVACQDLGHAVSSLCTIPPASSPIRLFLLFPIPVQKLLPSGNLGPPTWLGHVPPLECTDPRLPHPSSDYSLAICLSLLGDISSSPGLMRTGSRMSGPQPCPALPSPGWPQGVFAE